jgi:hypothetical protein
MKKDSNRKSNSHAVAVNRNWRKFMAVGCSHGHLADPTATEAVLGFKDRWQPDLMIHLGDFLDLSPLMGGGKHAEEDATSIAADFDQGIDFLHQLEANIVFAGNHEDRIFKLQQHSNSIVSYAADQCANTLEAAVKELKAEFVPYDIEQGWRLIGDTMFGHGYMCGESAIRDHAELVGKCCIAHLHRPGVARGRRLGGATGHCVGTLANIPAMAYAKIRKARTMWNHGFAYGEYCGGKNAETVLWIVEKGKTDWRMPL